MRGVAADLSTAEGLVTLQAAEPKADILVNNLGIYGQQDFFETSDEVWQQFFDVNVLSGVRVARAYTPAMVEKGWGRVVFIWSESGLNIPADMIHYGFTKSANQSPTKRISHCSKPVMNLCAPSALRPSSNALPAAKKSPIWWSTPAPIKLQRLPAQHCVWKVE